MQAMVLRELGPVTPDRAPLQLEEWPRPEPGPDEVLIRVAVCGVFL